MNLSHSTIRQVVHTLGNHVDRIAIFGSATYKELSDASDIDILLFVNPAEFNTVREHICSIDFNTSVYVEKLLCSYTKPPTIKKPERNDTGKPVHFAFLPNIKSEYMRTTLWRKNQHNILHL